MPRIIVVVLAALTLAACSAQPPEVSVNDQVPADQRTEATSPSEGASGAAGGSDPTWVAIDIEYEAAPEALPAGDTEITLTNNGAAPHDVTFEELGDETVVTADPGATATGTVALEAGELTYYCSVPGHREAGMEGTLTVE